MKRTSLLVLVLVLAGTVASWSGGAQEPAKAEAAGVSAPREKVILEYLTWYHADEAIRQEIRDGFEAKNPDISVNLVKMGAWDLHDKYLVNLIAGAGAGDVVSTVKRRFTKYSSTGRLYDLTPHVGNLKASYPESLWKINLFKGKVYGMALDEAPALLFYRKDLFEQVGYTGVETWDQFMDAGRKMKASGRYIAHRQYPSVNEGLEDLFIYLNSRGGNLYNEDGKVLDPNQGLKDILTMAHNMHFRDGITKFAKIYSMEFWAGYKDDSVASWPGATWVTSHLRNSVPEQAGKWAIGLWPKWSPSAPQVTGHWGGTVISVPGYSKHKAQAAELVKWMAATTEGQLMFAKTMALYPSYLPALEDPFIIQGEPYLNGQSPFAMVKQTPVPAYHQWDWAETAQIVANQLDLMWDRKQDVDTTYRNIIRDLKSELGR